MPRTKKTTTKDVKKKPSQSEIEFPPDPDELAFNKQMASIPLDKFDVPVDSFDVPIDKFDVPIDSFDVHIDNFDVPIDNFDEPWPPEEIDIFFPPDDAEKDFNQRMARWMAEEARKDQEMMRSLARDFPDVDLSGIPDFDYRIPELDDMDFSSLNDDYDRKMNRKRRSEKEE
jgi:hypothetical protein